MELCEKSLTAWKSLATQTTKEVRMRLRVKNFRRSIYFMKNMKAGETIKEEDIRIIRPLWY